MFATFTMFTDLKRTLGESVDCRSVNVGLLCDPFRSLTGMSLRFAPAGKELVPIATLVAECGLGVLPHQNDVSGQPRNGYSTEIKGDSRVRFVISPVFWRIRNRDE